jgi:hypothetical protein
MKDLEDKLEKSVKALDDILGEKQAKTKASEEEKQKQEEWDNQVKDFESEYADVDLAELGNNQKFLKFVKGKNLPLKQAYADFVDFIGETESQAIAKYTSKDGRSTSSGKSSSADGGGYGLTDSQKNLAQKSGMTYKEYSGYLKQITN